MKSIMLFLNLVVITHGLRLRLQTHQSPDVPTPEKAFKAVIFHADDRLPNQKDPSKVTIDEMSFIETASMVDYLYAEKYGYEFKHYVLPKRADGTAGVDHPTQGQRRVPWAKILILQKLNKAFPKADVVMMHDSDTSLQRFDKTLKGFMDEMRPGVVRRNANPENPRHSEGCTDVEDEYEISTMKQKSSIWLNNGCRGHFALMKPGKQATEILKKAWNFETVDGKNNWGFPWEQAAWDNLAIEQTKGLMMIAGVPQESGQMHKWKICKGADIELRNFNMHRSHFQGDSRWMQRGNTRMQPESRERIRADLGCGKDWENKCLDYVQLVDNVTVFKKKIFKTAYRDELATHEMYHGARKLAFLEVLRKQLGNDDNEVLRVYREMRARVVEITTDELDALSKELAEDPEEKPSLTKRSSQAYQNKNFENILDGLNHGLDDKAKDLPLDSRERNCWCDGP